ncbi:hypothetical protein M758_2G153500 [Ceratodon purpureus]|nr:hypothetical protein M758_2G153500 [Ceratodon purpureus]
MAESTMTVFGPALELMKTVKSPEGHMLTKPFLDVCRNVLPVIDKFGSSMALVKSDVGGNISVLFCLVDFGSEGFFFVIL